MPYTVHPTPTDDAEARFTGQDVGPLGSRLTFQCYSRLLESLKTILIWPCIVKYCQVIERSLFFPNVT